MAYAAIAMAGLQLVGSYYASQNIKETARLNQEIADMNAEFADLDAHDAIVEGESEQVRYQSVIDNTKSQQNAILAAQGVDTSFGSAQAIQEETDFIAEINLMAIEQNAQERALGYETQARQYRIGGQTSAARSEQELSNVRFQAATSAVKAGLSGYASFSSNPSQTRTTSPTGGATSSTSVPATNDFLQTPTL